MKFLKKIEFEVLLGLTIINFEVNFLVINEVNYAKRTQRNA